MSHIVASSVLSDEGVMTLLSTAIGEATAMGQPQCIAIVDASGVCLPLSACADRASCR